MTHRHLLHPTYARFAGLILVLGALVVCGCRPGAVQNPEQQLAELKATAAAAREAQRYNDAYIAYKQAAELAPDDFDVAYGLAETNTRLRNEVEAIDWVNTALRLQPDNQDALELKGRLYLSVGRLPEAIGVLEQVVAKHPDHTLAWLNLSAAYHSSGRAQDALAAVLRAVKSAPDRAVPHFALGDLYYSRGDLAKAESEYREAIARDDKHAGAYLRLADLYIKQKKDLKQAREWALRSNELYPGDGNAGERAATALFMLDEREEAVNELAAVAEDHPQNYRLWMRLGNMYEDLGDTERARAAYGFAAKFAPTEFRDADLRDRDKSTTGAPSADARNDA